ncbi:hypothetical protein [Sporichthya brevicatena]
MGRFDVSQIQVDVAGTQKFVLDAHITTRTGKPSEVITASIPGLAIYLYDLAAVRAFASAWNMAQRFVPVGMPERARPVLESTETSVGLLLHVAGTPNRRRINGVAAGASPTGKPFVRVEVGLLTIHARDLTSIRTAAASWADVERMALRMWPETDAFDQAEAEARKAVARSGEAARRMPS